MTRTSRTTRRRLAGDGGSAGIEAAIAVVALLSVMFFIVGALRVTNSAGDVDAAARAAARAAAAQRDMGAATGAASQVAASALASRGVACAGGPAVSVGGSVTPGGIVTVTVTCVVSLADARLGGFSGSRSVTGHGVESVDSARGGQP
jgi:Flp pilus assembly protein TadG